MKKALRSTKIDKSRFTFLDQDQTLLSKLLQNVNAILEGIVESKPYALDWDHVLSEYDQIGVGDVCEFAASYSFGWHAMNGKLKDKASKEAMYMEIIDGILDRRTNVF